MLATIVRRGGRMAAAARSVLSTSVRWSHPDLPAPFTDADPPSLVGSLRSASSSYELFEIVSLRRKEFSTEHVMSALKRLFHLQKNETTAIANKDILRNPDFEHLCRNLKHCARRMDVNDTIEAMKILNYVGVPTNSEISMTLLHLVRTQVNDISLGQIVFLDFLMSRFKATPLVDAFRIALPMLMQIQLAAKLDHENTAQLCDLLHFACRNPLSEAAVTSVVVALALHGTDLTLEEARSCVWSLCDLQQHAFTATHEKLLHNCLEVLCDSLARLPFDAMETTLAKMVQRCAKQREPAFYDEEFFGRCAQYVCDKDVGFLNALYIQRKFNRLNYASIEVIEYLTEKIHAQPQLLREAPPTAFMTYVAALSSAHYEPIGWSDLRPLVRANAFVSGEPRTNTPWLRCVLELTALGVVEAGWVSAACEPEFLRQQLAKNQNTLDMLQLLLLHQVTELMLPADYSGHRLPAQLVEKTKLIQLQRVETPLRATVERVFGEEAVWSALATDYGHFVDHVVVIERDGSAGKKLPLSDSATSESESDGEQEQRTVRFEDVRLAEGQRMVAVVAYPRSHYCINLPRLKGLFALRVRTLERLGVPVCVVNVDAWSALPDREKLDWLEREVRHKLT